MVRAFENVLKLDKGQLIIPKHYAFMGALGALLIVRESKNHEIFKGLHPLKEHIAKPYQVNTGLAPLKDGLTDKSVPYSVISKPALKNDEKIDAYLGVDVGSISTNVVLIDEQHRVLAKRYLPTASRPLQAIARGLDEIYEEIGDRIIVRGAGTTGSGRYLSGDVIGADVVCNEITAQATASIDIDPEVDTIFEIGGQDSKFISIDKGAIVDFEMNKVCAAGTGSFLEEQAERLNIDLKTEFTPLAMEAAHPVQLGDRCTVFMETDLVHHQQAGADRGDLLAGLAYSTVYNYLNRVVCGKRIGKRIFFQGGTAYNKSVVAAFNKALGREVIVPPHHEVTGAIGVAIIAHRQKGKVPSLFKGFDLSKRDFKLETFECASCPNHCEIHCVKMSGEKPLFYGSRCEKYDVDRSRKVVSGMPDLFAERTQLLYAELKKESPPDAKGVVAIPLCALFYEHLPFWTAFFQSLGFQVKVSGMTNKPLINRGVEAVVSETCFPIKVAHGHILDLINRKPDMVFLPSIVDSPSTGFSQKGKSCFNCPYIQSLPYTADAALEFKKYNVRVFSPALFMQTGPAYMKKEMSRYGDILESDKSGIFMAIDKAYEAQDRFEKALQKRGREVLAELHSGKRAIIIVGRPYNTCDSGVNLDLPKKLLGMNILPIPMDFLPLDDIPYDSSYLNMYWRSGQRILKAARFIRERQGLYALYVTNFGCGPDSFLLKFFARELGDKPFLQIEIDEHSADAGVITRCEAFLDTIAGFNGAVPQRYAGGSIISISKIPKGFTFYIPYMCNHAHVLESLFQGQGFDARVMDPPDDESLSWGRKYTTGKECYPALLTTGDIVRQVKRPGFAPDRTGFFLPSANGPCRYGQYGNLHRQVLDELGFDRVPVISLDQDTGFHSDMQSLSGNASRLAWQGIASVDLLERLLLSTRPYEKNPGDSDALYQEIFDELMKTLRAGGDVFPVLKKHVRRFYDIPIEPRGAKPLIGVVGEIYIRSNPPGNDFLVKTLESMGAEVAMPPISEWLNYVTLVRKWRNLHQKTYWGAVKDFLIEKYMHRIIRRMDRIAGQRTEAFPLELIEMAEPYLHRSFSGEAILSIGKTIEFIRDTGAAGVINVMPFTCMPGTVVTALLKRIHEDYDGFPCISLAYTGQQSLNLKMRLEAFLYQAFEYWKKSNSPPSREKVHV
ncbi:CoA activase, partial [Candidatus Sumerlaeota bacterium]|nr:CoA activase [Candidatus Sumerlaeota bacterium]